MRAWLKRIYRETDWGRRAFFPLVRGREWLRGGWRSDRSAIERKFAETFGYGLDWENPRTLNEKLNWMKLHFRDPLQKIVADKYAVRAHVAAKVGEQYLIPLIRKCDRAEEIRFSELPTAFVLKTNHGSGQNWIVRDKSREDERAVVRQFREWLATSHYAASREWPYKGMKPAIVVEELLLDENGQIPSDFKFHCFGGKVATIQVDLDRETAHRRNFYDLDWNLQPFIWTEWERGKPAWPNGRPVARPAALPEMVRVAETLAADFPYARIDLFYCGGKVYFGEITFYHGGAFERFDPPEFDRFFGEKLTLPRG
ncbi:MAG TPA: ATP-grasp fold amidoligase family protein [Kiritimatiellia bacterium]|nr:ATP-grasp fold amidoligase family protein [Kiritimatiellia bacterium]